MAYYTPIGSIPPTRVRFTLHQRLWNVASDLERAHPEPPVVLESIERIRDLINSTNSQEQGQEAEVLSQTPELVYDLGSLSNKYCLQAHHIQQQLIQKLQELEIAAARLQGKPTPTSRFLALALVNMDAENFTRRLQTVLNGLVAHINHYRARAQNVNAPLEHLLSILNTIPQFKSVCAPILAEKDLDKRLKLITGTLSSLYPSIYVFLCDGQAVATESEIDQESALFNSLQKPDSFTAIHSADRNDIVHKIMQLYRNRTLVIHLEDLQVKSISNRVLRYFSEDTQIFASTPKAPPPPPPPLPVSGMNSVIIF